MKDKALIFLLGILFPCCLFAEPVSINSCGRKVIIDQSPNRAVSHDINMTEMMFALGLQQRMAGYSGVSGYQKVDENFKTLAGDLPQLAEKTLSIESLLSVNADFLFAGWNYGLQVGGAVTPEKLKALGINTYELTESCIHIMSKASASFDDIYQDLFNLGKIFAVEEKSHQLVDAFKKDLQIIQEHISKTKTRPRVFLYDSGLDAPFTSGRYAMPHVMIEAAGGMHVMQDLPISWGRTQWEAVVRTNPEVIVIVNYGQQTAQQKTNFLVGHPALKDVSAIKNRRFVVLPYRAVTPGVGVFSAIKQLMQAFHPTIEMK